LRYVDKKLLFHLCLGLLGLEFLDVEVELFTLQNVTVGAAALAWSRVDLGQKFTLKELAVKVGSDIGSFGTGVVLLLSLSATALQLVDGSLLLLGKGVVLFTPKSLSVVRLVVGSEGSSIKHDDGTLDERLGSDQLVTGRVVDDVDDTTGSRDALGSPTKVSVVETQSSELLVTTHASDRVYTLRLDLGVGSWSSEFELSLLVHLWFSATGLSAFVP